MAGKHYLDLRYGQRHQEVVGALYLDSRNRLLTDCELYRGTVSRSVVEPRAVLREGLMRGATEIVLFHTHPSGDPTPSAEDLQLTRRLAQAGEVLGVTLVDHLIVGHGGRWISLPGPGRMVDGRSRTRHQRHWRPFVPDPVLRTMGIEGREVEMGRPGSAPAPQAAERPLPAEWTRSASSSSRPRGGPGPPAAGGLLRERDHHRPNADRATSACCTEFDGTRRPARDRINPSATSDTVPRNGDERMTATCRGV